MNRWLNKQYWRYKQAWLFVQPFLDVLVKFMWIIATIALTAWFIVTLDMAILFFVFFNIILWVLGFGGDKTGFWQEFGARQYKIVNTELTFHMWRAQGAFTAKPIIEELMKVFPDIGTEGVDAIVAEEKRWFEMKEAEEEE
jgi:hypothetical protein